MEIILGLLVLAVIIEAVTQIFKGALVGWEWVAIIFGVILCPLTGIDVFTILGLPLVVPGVPWLGGLIGSVLTGVMASRGSSFLYDVWKRIRGLTEEQTAARR